MGKRIAGLVLSMLVLMACGLLSPAAQAPTCVPPPNSQESDLVGTWTDFDAPRYSTVTVKADYTYRQVYQNSVTGFHFEGSWQPWWIEYRPSGIPYLHLVRMRMCQEGDGYCGIEEGGGGSTPWRDYCENRQIEMRGEVIFFVLKAPRSIGTPPAGWRPYPRGIWLVQLSESMDTATPTFKLEQ